MKSETTNPAYAFNLPYDIIAQSINSIEYITNVVRKPQKGESFFHLIYAQKPWPTGAVMYKPHNKIHMGPLPRKGGDRWSQF